MPDSLQPVIDTSPFPEVQWIGRKVLFATSDQDLARNMNGFLGAEGMNVSVAESDTQAMSLFQQDSFDLLIIDVDLEGDGLKLGHRIKMSMRDDFVPLLFITAKTDELSLASCFEAGGDDLVQKPYGETILFSRINALLKMGGVYRQQYKEREELAYYHAMMETEQRLAKSIFTSIVHQDYLEHENIRYTLSPMSIFNGDMLLAANTLNGHEYVLLGDFTGHGLTASVGTLPVSEIFYAMTAKGFGLEVIIGEINKRLRNLLPVGMFMATYAIDVNWQDNILSVWGGGIPDLLLLRAADGRIEHIKAKNLPLGIVDTTELNLQMEIFPVHPGDRFYIYTDGVTESENKEGEMFGADRLQRVMTEAARGDNVYSAVMTALDEFRAGHEQSDDITLLEYTLKHGNMDNFIHQCMTKDLPDDMNSEWSINLKLEPKAIREFDPRPLLTQLIADVHGLYSNRSRFYTVLSELFENAVNYGLLGMKASDAVGDIREFVAERQKRLDALSGGYILIGLGNVPYDDGGGMLSITVEDSGQGAGYQDLLSMPDKQMPKGLLRLKKLTDELQLEKAGKKITARCRWYFNNQ